MPSPASDVWWGTFLVAEGNDSEEHAAFLGYLVTQGVPSDSDPDVLQTAYGSFRAFMEESEKRGDADPGPSAAELAARQASAAVAQVAMPKSRVSAPHVQKPLTAMTRPVDTRRPLAEAPTAEAPAAPAQTAEAAHGAGRSVPRTRTGE